MGIAKGIGIVVLSVFIVAFSAFLGGTIVWLIWPVAIPAAFPGLVASGALAVKLAWWQAVCLTWLFAILIKTTVSATSNAKK